MKGKAGTSDPSENQHQIPQLFASLVHLSSLFWVCRQLHKGRPYSQWFILQPLSVILFCLVNSSVMETSERRTECQQYTTLLWVFKTVFTDVLWSEIVLLTGPTLFISNK